MQFLKLLNKPRIENEAQADKTYELGNLVLNLESSFRETSFAKILIASEVSFPVEF